MKRMLHIITFLALSVAVHAAALVQLPGSGAAGAGQGGEDRATLQAATGDMGAMVARWTAPPQITQPQTMQPVSADMAEMPRPAATEDTRPALPLPSDLAAPALPESTPQADVSDRRPQAVTLSQRPVARPADRPQRAPQASTSPGPAQTRRTAAGQGNGAARGASETAPVATLSSAARQSLMARWGAQINARIERRKPRVTGQGVVTLQLRIGRDGRLQHVAVARSSGNAQIDQAGLRAVQRAGHFPAAPEGLSEPSYRFDLPIRFL
ncbi:TonB family protein [Rhodophyticola sp. CCM32]|uniref:TonB family protein n=1 Tax=Rhodophyticola sp. CCM32 TaxID=2916397 RepID=UPI00107F8CA3|nr:TonB family protein [Rhodophyticola sp. CCM32]QBY01860.1 TonB family protein [Rhodophyticola sp. CCM32]